MVVVEEPVPRLRVLLDVVIDAECVQRLVEAGRPHEGSYPCRRSCPRSGMLRAASCRSVRCHAIVHLEASNRSVGANSRANPPPMQKPITPIFPVQPVGRPARRVASISANAPPRGL